MSLILKSNTLYTGTDSFPKLEQVMTNAAESFAAYKDRVLADGGVITSESKVMSAYMFLFENNLIGRMSCCSSPYYGVKKVADGRVSKLYSLDGTDLISDLKGTAKHPSITSEGYLHINEHVTTTLESANRCIIRTETKQVFNSSNQIGHAFVFKSNGLNLKMPTIALSRWEDWVWLDDEGIEVSIRDNLTESKVTTKGVNNSVISHTHTEGRGATVLRVDAKLAEGNFQLFNAGIKFRTNTSEVDPNLFVHPLHVIYGGMKSYLDDRHNKATNTLLSCMWFVNDLYEKEAVAINDFMTANYI